MIKVINKTEEVEFDTLDLAMIYAMKLGVFVTIKGNNFEVVSMFGVDTIKDGVCPDGIAYDWNKSSRIGATKR